MLMPVQRAATRIETISVCDSLDRVAPLLAEHWDEIARNKELMVLKPNAAAYSTLEKAGALLALGAFAGDEMVGYSVTIVSPHLHYADLLCAQNDVIFVTRARRAGRLGLQLLRETERHARARGARLMLWHAKQHTVLDALLPRLGYGVQDIIYSREL